MIDRKSGERKVGFLNNLTIKELSGVDRPANPGARIVLCKSESGVEVTKRYDSNDALPDVIKRSLPVAAQDDFRHAVNTAFAKDDDADEETVFKAAWDTVKSKWQRQGDTWVAKAAPPPFPPKKKKPPADEEEAAAAAAASAAAAAAAAPPAPPAKPAVAPAAPVPPTAPVPPAKKPPPAQPAAAAPPAAEEVEDEDEEVPPKKKGKAQYPWMQKADEGDTDMDVELKKQVDDLTAERDTLKTECATLKGEIEKMKVAADDEVIKVDDTEIRKSAVGEATFKAMRAQQTRIEKAELERELTQLEKRAEADFGALPGTNVDKAKVLKELQRIPEEQRTEIDKMLKAGSAAITSMMRATGSASSYNVDKGNELDVAVAKFAELHKITDSHKAMDNFLKTEEGKRLYREQLERAPAH